MKRIFAVVLGFIFMSAPYAQDFRGIDKSPMDMAYFPDNFAHDRTPGEKAVLRVTYSRPQKNGREIFGKHLPYGRIWRAGANEATEIKFYQDVEMAGKNVKAGSYSLYAIPAEKEWTIILNSDLDNWGAYSYNEKNDVIRITAQVKPLNATLENFTIQFAGKGGKEGVMKLAWDKTMVEVPFRF